MVEKVVPLCRPLVWEKSYSYYKYLLASAHDSPAFLRKNIIGKTIVGFFQMEMDIVSTGSLALWS
jgi:hypothetical protein